MQTETLVGLISGLGGAVIGAGGALLGGWLQQRHQAKVAREERQEGHSRAAAEAGLSALLIAQRAILGIDSETNPSRALAETVLEQIHAARHATFLLIQADEARDRLEEIFQVLLYFEHAESGSSRAEDDEAIKDWFFMCTSEALEVLGAYMRGETIPERRRQYTEMMTGVANSLSSPSEDS